ncbi:regulator of protease activity HflC (stomatin/prohibitin superfamily) [Actinomadura luteofluorescens]|uniref:Regulator of protease activity HflC (Stomatin/prohibitin superfamily) n=1 Tax=Actinomadura luteofluorescens TaxID=46163 RepID=A0A7Y9EIL5_9ACTN|nr:slipin family protein [Actinomadura luteofluorescens]NYD48476.1 regulator of protease activity HflC (stomatin/prohibitin superfamily) [Actinomadura luteofluorescens]
MEAVALIILLVIVVVGLIVLSSSIRVVQQFEHGIVFRFGQVQRNGQLRPGAVRAPGLTVIVPIAERMQKVSRQTITMGVPGQDGITQDNVSVRVDAVVYFRVIDPVKAIVNVHNYGYAVSQVAQTSLRSVIGQADMQELLGEREKINMRLRAIIDEITEGPWGILIERVEIKDVSLPEGMKRSMARQAEAERERRARIITADGEFQASKRLAAAAEIMSQDPAALQLRLLQTVVEVSAEKNSTLVMPLPVEILRFFERAAGGAAGRSEDGGESKPDLGERLAKAEEELAKAAEQSSSLESAEEVPPVIGLDEPKRRGSEVSAPREEQRRGIGGGAQETPEEQPPR